MTLEKDHAERIEQVDSQAVGPASTNPSGPASGWTSSRKSLAVIAAVALGYWALKGFPSPDTLAHYWFDAENECAQFADKHKAKLFFGKSNVKAMGSWLKNGKVVVEVAGYNEGEDTYTSRICTIGDGSIQIVSILESGAWR